jgi:hypothetical protein
MEIILAAAVIAAVIVFGALISRGNERQRKALDELREQIIHWAVQDLRIKREKLALDVRVDDPIGWLNHQAARVLGINMNLQVLEVFENPQVLVCQSTNGARVLFSPLSPTEVRTMNRMRKGKLAQYANGHPLLGLSGGLKGHELSSLNSGLLFDLELPLAWKALTGREEVQMERLWMYPTF